jgi:hypothetical protein
LTSSRCFNTRNQTERIRFSATWPRRSKRTRRGFISATQWIVPIPEQRECKPRNSLFLRGKRYADFFSLEDSLGSLVFSRGEAGIAAGELDEFGYCGAVMLRDLNAVEEKSVWEGDFLF